MNSVLQKFTSSSVDLTACILVTDTRAAWAEGKYLSSHWDETRAQFNQPHRSFSIHLVLTSNQFARRWRTCNQLPISPIPHSDSEESWRDHHITLLGRAHSLGGFQDLTFEVVKPTLGVTLSAICRNMIRSDTFIGFSVRVGMHKLEVAVGAHFPRP